MTESTHAQQTLSPRGLTSEHAAALLRQHGPNETVSVQRATALLQFLRFFLNPLVVILVISSAVSFTAGERISAGIILIIVILSAVVNFAQTYRSDRAIEHLRQGIAPRATVLRDGKWVEIPRRELVPGDVIHLTGGDLVPADATLLESRDLHVQQAALTGESLPVEKDARGEEGDGGTDSARRVFLGTSVVSGTAIAEVKATGKSTAFGDIASRLVRRAPETEFERGARRFGFLITQTVFFLVLLTLVINIALRRNPLESLLFSVALAVGLTPEFLPMIVAVTLAQGAVHMARRKVIVKQLSALQNFGSMDVLCSDKTGTLTSGEIVMKDSIDPNGAPSDRVFELAYLNCAQDVRIESSPSPARLNPLDAAVLRYKALDTDYKQIQVIPFDFERRRQSVVVAGPSGRMLISKGAPEGIIASCEFFERGGRKQPLDDAARRGLLESYERLSADGFRVVAVAWREIEVQASYSSTDETGLIAAGFLTFFDPPLEDADDMLRALRRDGVHVKIITGDSDLVARHVCTQVGLRSDRIVLGREIDGMTDVALGHVAEECSIFARISPAQKNRIILALKFRGHVVGFFGDGINDAPSLHAADIGISAAGATEVAKDAADIILLKPGLRVLHGGIMEGRRAFGNVMKYLLMGTSSNFGNMVSMAGASLFLKFLPMLPSQILLNNFLYDLAQITIPTDHVDMSFIRKPRKWDIGVIRRFMLFIGPISSIYDFLTFAALIHFFHAGEALFHTGWFVESLATQTLVLFVIRTASNPFQSRPSRPLAWTVVAVVGAGMLIPFTRFGDAMGFVALPAGFFAFLILATATYLLLVEFAKRRLL